ncbi:inactive tyrosine-protein kinase 7a [Chanos chanos]|uniref:Inactive tyrosine-protein kinase 7 n=1 Tax=Chanos chanos TaxID=29144 RepID=A0A6J2V9T7_CHACN|nr:inactive tyrosine-protein kinase 7-like [Chanos chanos]
MDALRGKSHAETGSPVISVTDVHVVYESGSVYCGFTCVQSVSLQFTKEPKSQDALHGRSAILRCEVNNPEDVMYSWVHNGVTVTDTERRFQEGSNLKFVAIDRTLDSGNFQCIAFNNVTKEEERTSNASFNIKWLESGSVMLLEPSTEAWIESSSPVKLQCDIDGHPRPTNRWYRDGVQLTDRSYRINNRERTLTLSSVSPDDNGLYYCCAKNAVGQVCSNDNFTLNIIDKSYPQPVVKPEDLVVLKNEAALFHCQFTAEPEPTVEWYHENDLVANKSRVFLLNNGSLLITQVKPRNTGLYKCVAKGPRGPPVAVEASLHLAEIQDMPAQQSRVFTADSLERVSCQPPRGHPEPEVWWERGGQRIPAEGRVYQDALDLIFSPTKGEDSGTYTCIAENKAGQRKQELTVTVATPPEWVKRPEDSQLEEGQAGYLHCVTQATPKPEVKWFRNYVPIYPEDLRFKVFPNGTLRINSVEVYDAHVYQCQSQTQAGVLTAQARVSVLEKLKFTPTPQSFQCLELDKEDSLQCSAKGRETPIIQWTKDGSDVPESVKQNGGVLLFSTVTRADAGNYTCVASNSLQGEIRAMVQVTVAVYVGFKLKPENTTVYQGHTAVLHCQATGDPPPFIQWKKKDKFLEANKSRFQKMSNGSLVIYDVGMEDIGTYTCIAGNSCNIGHTSAELIVVERPVQYSTSDEEKTPYKMIQTIGLSVGAAVAYIIIVLGLMFYCKQRRNAKKLQKGQEGEEPEMVHLNGGTEKQNGHVTAEIQEEVTLASIPPATNGNKRHSSHDKLHFSRANLHNMTVLGKGEFGEVLLAKLKTGKEEEETVVMVKSLQTKDEQLQLDFRRESEMFAKLNHTNVIRLIGVCKQAEPHYMILEYSDMGDLKQFLKISKNKDEKTKVQPLSTKQKVSLCLQVARGMEHLSNQRFVHRDLAARNCLISAKRHAKVSALGLSKDVYKSEYYHYRQAWIPLRWLPAESVFEDDFSTKTDVWSFGVFMWEVFTFGELPHAELADDNVLEGLREGELKLPPPQGCPSRVYKLMVRCWAPSPKERVSFTDIVTALNELPSEKKM